MSRGEFKKYMQLLKDNYSEENVSSVMCKSLVSIDWEGYLFDCDFNQMLGLPLGDSTQKTHIQDLNTDRIHGKSIAVRDHCFGCTAGRGSSCSGALQ